MKRSFIIIALFLSTFLVTPAASAQSVGLGLHGGGLGITGAANGGIGYGAHLIAQPFSLAGFKIDATFADLDGGNFFSTSPSFILYPVDFIELKMGILGGATLVKYGSDADLEFGLNVGALGELGITDNFRVGMEAKYHSVFETEDFWTVMVTSTYHFELGAW